MLKNYDIDKYNIFKEEKYKKVINYLSYRKNKDGIFFGLVLNEIINDIKKDGIIVSKEKVISDIKKKENGKNFCLEDNENSSILNNSNEMLIKQINLVRKNNESLFNLDKDNVIYSKGELLTEKEMLIDEIISLMDTNELQVVSLYELKKYLGYMSLEDLNDMLDKYLNKDKLVYKLMKY